MDKIECLDHLLFAAYLILLAWICTKTKFFNNSGLTKSQIVILFLLKVMAGIFYGWIGVYYGNLAKMIDTWYYHYESLNQYELLKSDPGEFFASFFRTTYDDGYSNFLASKNSWWNDIKAVFLIKILAIFNLFSFGNYYINVIFLSFFTLFGPVALFRVMNDVFPGKKLAVLLACFLIPSFLYWTGGIHKEGGIFTAISLIIYHCYFGFKEKRFGLTRISIIAMCFILILIFRNFLILTLIPPLIGWFISENTRVKPIIVFSSVFLAFIIIFFTAKYFHPALDFPKATVNRQYEFLKLEGGSTVEVKRLTPDVKSFAVNIPQALSMSILRPYPSDVRHLLSLVAATEITIILLFFVVFLFWRKNGTGLTAFILFCLFFSLAVLLMVGYTVNNLGAIVRYRSIILPLLLVPMAAKIDWDRIGKLISGNIKNFNNPR